MTLLKFHRAHGKLVTVTAVRPPARFGCMVFEGNAGSGILRKTAGQRRLDQWSFFCMRARKYLIISTATQTALGKRADGKACAKQGQLMAYRHEGFWQCMDTLRDKRLLETLWESGNPPWTRKAS